MIAIDIVRLYQDEHAGLVRRVARRCGVSLDDAEDAVQFAWMQLLHYAASLDGKNLGGWLYVVARNEMVYRLRRHGGDLPLIEDLVPGERGGQLVAFDDDVHDAADALRVLASLKPQQRQCLAARVAGLSYREQMERDGRSYTWVNRHTTEGHKAARAAREAA